MIIEEVTGPGICPHAGCWCDYLDPLCFAFPCEDILTEGDSCDEV